MIMAVLRSRPGLKFETQRPGHPIFGRKNQKAKACIVFVLGRTHVTLPEAKVGNAKS